MSTFGGVRSVNVSRVVTPSARHRKLRNNRYYSSKKLESTFSTTPSFSRLPSSILTAAPCTCSHAEDERISFSKPKKSAQLYQRVPPTPNLLPPSICGNQNQHVPAHHAFPISLWDELPRRSAARNLSYHGHAMYGCEDFCLLSTILPNEIYVHEHCPVTSSYPVSPVAA